MGTILHLRQEWFQGKLMFLLSYTNTPPQVIKEQLPLQVTQHNCVERAGDSVNFKITSRMRLIFF